jgi:zinc transporter ZupT
MIIFMVEGNFKNKQKHSHNHRFSFMDPLVLMVLAACSQPLGQWILSYMLDEVESVKYINYMKLLYSFMSFLLGVFISLLWYKFSRRKS